MSRKAVAIAIILLISCLAPATAVLAFCAQTPCCAQEETAAIKSNRGGDSCCTPVSCYESQESKPVQGAATAPSIAVPTHSLAPVGDQAPAPQVALYFNESSPPPSTARRLSALSTLLI